jgi:type I restriction enzyme S subunit
MILLANKINGYYVVRPEDFVYNPRISTTAPVGPIGRNKLGRCGVYITSITVFRPKEVDNSFLEQFFKSSHWYSFMRFNGIQVLARIGFLSKTPHSLKCRFLFLN